MIRLPYVPPGTALPTGLPPALSQWSAPVPILCISDDTALAEQELLPPLVASGFEVQLLASGCELPDEIRVAAYALALFDIAFPSSPGYELCARLSRGDLPLMFVLRGEARSHALRGYEAGADSYILAPYDPRELLARLSALLRRRGPPVRVATE